MSFPAYPSYKDSGVEWMGQVPDHWQAKAIKREYAVIGGSTPKSDEPEYWDGDISWVTPSDLSKLSGFDIDRSGRSITEAGLNSCGTRIVPAGSVVLSTRAPIGSLAIAVTPLCTNQGCKSLVPLNALNSKFLAYTLSVTKAELNIRGKGTTFLELSGDELGSFKVPTPTFDEQNSIVAFLDYETAKIDALLYEQDKMIGLLNEQVKSAMTHAVISGINPLANSKETQVDWFGAIPSHWKFLSMRRVVEKIEQGWSPNAASHPCEHAESGVLKLSSIKRGQFYAHENKALIDDVEPIKELMIQPGDFLLTRANTPELVGDCCVVPSDFDGNLMLSDLIYRLTLSKDLSAEFLSYFLQSGAGRYQVEVDARGSSMSMAKISQGHILSWYLALPPINEQIAIVKYLNVRFDATRKLIAKSLDAKRLLIERREALILEAVTGKIDIRSIVATQQ